MAITSNVARQLCTKPELELFTSSLRQNIGRLNERSLRSRVTRSRTLRDKYRSLAERQEREAAGKQDPRGRRPSQGSAQTRKKEQLFAETLERFERQLSKLEADAQAAAAKPVKKATKKKAPTKKASAPKAKKASTKSTAKTKTTKKKSSAASTSATTKKLTKKAAPKKKKRAPSGRTESAKVAAKETRLTSAGKMRKQKHTSATNRRNQARRDSR